MIAGYVSNQRQFERIFRYLQRSIVFASVGFIVACGGGAHGANGVAAAVPEVAGQSTPAAIATSTPIDDATPDVSVAATEMPTANTSAITPIITLPGVQPSPQSDVKVPAILSFHVPAAVSPFAQNARHAQYLSPSNASIKIIVTPQGGSASAPATGTCNSGTCTIAFTAAVGANAIAFTLYDGTGGTGNVLATYATTIIAQPIGLNTFKLSASGVVDHVILSLSSSTINAGTAGTVIVTVNAQDKDNNTIIGQGNYVDATGAPLSLILSTANTQAGGTGSVSIVGPTIITGPVQKTIYAQYNGKWLDHSDISVRSTRPLAVTPGSVTLSTTPTITPYSGCNDHAMVALGPDGNFWCTNPYDYQIIRLTPTGASTVFTTGITGITHDIAVGADGNLWFTEGENNKIGRITISGVATEFTIPTGSSHPAGITRGPDGNMYFEETTAAKVGRITPQGLFTEFNLPATQNVGGSYGGLDSVSGLETKSLTFGPDGNLWIAENNNNNRVTILTRTGTQTLLTIGSSQNTGIITGTDGNLWVSNYATGGIRKVTPTGAVTTYAAAPIGGQMLAGFDGNLWLAPSSTNLVRIATDGTLTTYAIGGGDYPWGLTNGTDDSIWFTKWGGGNTLNRFVL